MSKVQQPVKQTKQGRRAERRQESQRKQEERKREAKQRRNLIIGGGVVAVVVVIAFVLFSMFNQNTANGTGATADTSNSLAPVVDNIACEANEQLVYHIHAHLSIYINGQQQALPANIGINNAQGCIYWLHTHDTTGVLHIESPTQKTYMLGNFFHVWSQQFSQLQYPVELDQPASDWKVYVNGKPYTGDFNKIPLDAHTLITMAFNSPNAPIDTVYNWSGL
jgi:hypothetical protein